MMLHTSPNKPFQMIRNYVSAKIYFFLFYGKFCSRLKRGYARILRIESDRVLETVPDRHSSSGRVTLELWITVNCGVPQGSSLGPKLFIAYTEELDEVLDQHHMIHHCFADDTQAYVDVPRSQVATVAPQLQNCIADMSNWCGARRLCL